MDTRKALSHDLYSVAKWQKGESSTITELIDAKRAHWWCRGEIKIWQLLTKILGAKEMANLSVRFDCSDDKIWEFSAKLRDLNFVCNFTPVGQNGNVHYAKLHSFKIFYEDKYCNLPCGVGFECCLPDIYRLDYLRVALGERRGGGRNVVLMAVNDVMYVADFIRSACGVDLARPWNFFRVSHGNVDRTMDDLTKRKSKQFDFWELHDLMFREETRYHMFWSRCASMEPDADGERWFEICGRGERVLMSEGFMRVYYDYNEESQSASITRIVAADNRRDETNAARFLDIHGMDLNGAVLGVYSGKNSEYCMSVELKAGGSMPINMNQRTLLCLVSAMDCAFGAPDKQDRG